MQIWINVLNNGLIVAIFAMSLSALVGAAGQLSVAPAGFGAVGAYIAGFLAGTHGQGFWIAMLGGIAAAAAAGLLIGVPALRLSLEHVILLTLAFATTIVAVFTAIPAFNGQYGLSMTSTMTVFGHDIILPTQFLKVVLPITLFCALICWRMVRSPFGRVLRGIREDSEAVQSLGKNQVAYKILIFVVTSGMAGAAGVLFFYFAQVVSPGQYGFSFTTTIMAGVILGGMTSLLGSFLGAVVLTFIAPVLQQVINISPTSAGLWQLVAFGAILVGVMLVRPSGLITENMTIRRFFERGHRSEVAFAGVPVAVPAFPAAPESDETVIAESSDAHLPRHGTATSVASEPPADEVQVVLKDLRSSGTQGDSIVVAQGLAKAFGGIRAVQGLDMVLPQGQITALVGPNGAGKTTVFNLLTGRLRLDAGSVQLRGEDVTGMAPHVIAHRGMVRSFQDVRVFQLMSLLDNVTMAVPDNIGSSLRGVLFRPFASQKADSRAQDVAMDCLEIVGLRHRALEPAAVLGYGDQKLLALARLIATGAEVYLVDEPASGIDRRNLDPVLDAIVGLRERGATVCIVEHNLDVVGRLADHVLFMEGGRVTARGTMAEITADERLAEVYFGHVRSAS